MILFEDGKELGVISNWKLIERFPEKRTVLGKEIVTQKPKDQCQFDSPKPVKRKKTYWIVSDDNTKLMLSELNVKGGTAVTATISERLPVD